jgi:hypothetical protein
MPSQAESTGSVYAKVPRGFHMGPGVPQATNVVDGSLHDPHIPVARVRRIAVLIISPSDLP